MFAAKRSAEQGSEQPSKKAAHSAVRARLDAMSFYRMATLFHKLQTEYSLTFKPDGLEIQFTTEDRTSLVRAWIDSSMTVGYRCDREMVIGVKSLLIKKACKFAAEGAVVELTADMDRVTPMVRLKMETKANAAEAKKGKKRASQLVNLGIPSLELQGDGAQLEPPEPSGDYCTAILPAYEFFRNLLALSELEINEVIITMTGPELKIVSVDSEGAEADIRIDLTDGDDTTYDMHSETPISQPFSIRLLLAGDVSRMTDYVELTLTRDNPARLRYSMDWGEFTLWVAPRIDD